MARSKVKQIDKSVMARVCPACNLYRPPIEFRVFGRIEKLCNICRMRAARANYAARVK